MPDPRIEKDTLGVMQVPANARWGPQTQRAVENFPVSGERMPPAFLHALGLVKAAAARVNGRLGLVPRDEAAAIETAALEVAAGLWDAEFPVDVFQTGSGTSTNMNANEVIAHLASERLGRAVHPNDGVNCGQSSNDTIPTALHVAAVREIEGGLLSGLAHLHGALEEKARAFDAVVKPGRTHLMDATPIRLGQEMSGYASQIEHGIARVNAVLPDLRELAIGGTAVGTGIATHPDFGPMVVAELAQLAGTKFQIARNHFEAQAARDAAVWASGALNTVAASLMKIANDLRLLASGPRCGLAEVTLPALQPGSSIMPGKINPVISEAVVQVAAQVMGLHVAITAGGQWGQLELNAMLPLIARNLLESIRLLGNVSRLFADKAVAGLVANEERCRDLVERSASMITALVPVVGYEAAARVAQRAVEEGVSVRAIAGEMTGLSDEQIEHALDPRRQTEPGAGVGGGQYGPDRSSAPG